MKRLVCINETIPKNNVNLQFQLLGKKVYGK